MLTNVGSGGAAPAAVAAGGAPAAGGAAGVEETKEEKEEGMYHSLPILFRMSFVCVDMILTPGSLRAK